MTRRIYESALRERRAMTEVENSDRYIVFFKNENNEWSTLCAYPTRNDAEQAVTEIKNGHHPNIPADTQLKIENQ